MASRWSMDEDELIRRWYPEKGPSWEKWAEMLPGRTYKAINVRAGRIGVRCDYRGPRTWTKSEDRSAVTALAEVCKTTGRSPESVIHRLDHLVHESRRALRAKRKTER